ncbi:MAG: hypothetical protein R3E08_02690 [Thiotrichaceae bacterium]
MVLMGRHDEITVQKYLLTDLAIISLFMQSVTLLSIGGLCGLRCWLAKIQNQLARGTD